MKTIAEVLGERDVYSVQSTLSVKEVVDFLCEHGVGAVAVCEGEDLVGVFSERDVMHRVVQKGLVASEVKLSEVMTKDPVCVSVEESCAVAKAMMFDKNFRHLVVIDVDGRLRGFVSMRELLESDLADTKDLVRKLNDDYYQEEFGAAKKNR